MTATTIRFLFRQYIGSCFTDDQWLKFDFTFFFVDQKLVSLRYFNCKIRTLLYTYITSCLLLFITFIHINFTIGIWNFTLRRSVVIHCGGVGNFPIYSHDFLNSKILIRGFTVQGNFMMERNKKKIKLINTHRPICIAHNVVCLSHAIN